ncbi:MAG: hypothetical protein ABIE92_14205 [bacterium]
MSQKTKILLISVVAILLLLLVAGCTRDPINADGSKGGGSQNGGNLPPTTNLFLYPDSAGLDTMSSVLEIHWWGQDPDGWVVGYWLEWDYFAESVLNDSIWLTSEYETFYLPLDSAFDEFSLTVRAVDNTAIWDYPSDLKVAQALGGEELVTAGIWEFIEYEAFLDVGTDVDAYDSGDSVLWAGNIEGIQTEPGMELMSLGDAEIPLELLAPSSVEGAIDMVGDNLVFRVENTPPDVEFRIESNPNLIAGETYTSFPTRSFFWEATDLDGEATIDSCYYVLDPEEGDTNWIALPGTATSVGLSELEPGFHRFFLKIVDIAGAASTTLSFPDTSDRYWEVVAPYGNLLIIDDYSLDANNEHLNLYKSIFDTLEGIDGEYSVWEVGSNLPYAMSDVLATMNYFDEVLWYSYFQLSHYIEAASAITSYLENDGAMLISALQIDTSNGLLPIAEFEGGLARIMPNQPFMPVQEDWPELGFMTIFSFGNMQGLTAAENGEILYNINEDVIWDYPEGFCIRRTDLDLVYISAPLGELNGLGTLPEYLRKVFIELFE